MFRLIIDQFYHLYIIGDMETYYNCHIKKPKPLQIYLKSYQDEESNDHNFDIQWIHDSYLYYDYYIKERVIFLSNRKY